MATGLETALRERSSIFGDILKQERQQSDPHTPWGFTHSPPDQTPSNQPDTHHQNQEVIQTNIEFFWQLAGSLESLCQQSWENLHDTHHPELENFIEWSSENNPEFWNWDYNDRFYALLEFFDLEPNQVGLVEFTDEEPTAPGAVFFEPSEPTLTTSTIFREANDAQVEAAIHQELTDIRDRTAARKARQLEVEKNLTETWTQPELAGFQTEPKSGTIQQIYIELHVTPGSIGSDNIEHASPRPESVNINPNFGFPLTKIQEIIKALPTKVGNHVIKLSVSQIDKYLKALEVLLDFKDISVMQTDPNPDETAKHRGLALHAAWELMSMVITKSGQINPEDWNIDQAWFGSKRHHKQVIQQTLTTWTSQYPQMNNHNAAAALEDLWHHWIQACWGNNKALNQHIAKLGQNPEFIKEIQALSRHMVNTRTGKAFLPSDMVGTLHYELPLFLFLDTGKHGKRQDNAGLTVDVRADQVAIGNQGITIMDLKTGYNHFVQENQQSIDNLALYALTQLLAVRAYSQKKDPDPQAYTKVSAYPETRSTTLRQGETLKFIFAMLESDETQTQTKYYKMEFIQQHIDNYFQIIRAVGRGLRKFSKQELKAVLEGVKSQTLAGLLEQIDIPEKERQRAYEQMTLEQLFQQAEQVAKTGWG